MNRRWVSELRLALPRLAVVGLVLTIGMAIAWLPWKWTALLLVGTAGMLGLLLRPEWTLGLLALAVPFGSLWEVSLGPVNVGAAEVLVALLVAFWVARMVAARRVVIPRAPLLVPLLFFLAAIVLSTLATTSLELSAKEIVKWLEVLAIYLFMASETSGASRASQSGALGAGRSTGWAIWALLAAASLEALTGIYQFLFRVGPEGFLLFGRFMRAYGHFAQPNPFAGYLGLSLPLAYSLLLDPTLTLAWRNMRGAVWQTLLRALPYLAAVTTVGLAGLAMLMSWSRGSWVGLLAALLVMTVMRSRRVLILALSVVLVVVYLLLIGGARYLPPALVQRASDFLPYASGVDVRTVQVTDANFAVVERTAHWMAALGMFSDHIWLGVGIGNYPVAYPQYAVGRWRDPLGHAHNYYLNIAAEAGLIGLIAYLVLFGACLIYAWRVTRRTQGFWRAVALGVLGVLVYLSVHNLFDNLFVHSMNVQLGLMLGLLAVADRNRVALDAHRD